jgi:ribosomal-protein-serine acetyltransferase
MTDLISLKEDAHLRLLQREDAENLFSLVNRNREFLGQFLAWPSKTLSVQDSKDFIEATLEAALTFGVFYQEALAGIASYHPIDKANKRVALGYWLGEDFQGKGLMTKAVGFLVSNGFRSLGLNRIEIFCATLNKPSQAIPERLHFKKEGTLRSAEVVGDRVYDHFVYSIIKSEVRES